METNKGKNWDEFLLAVRQRFDPDLDDDHVGRSATLRQPSSSEALEGRENSMNAFVVCRMADHIESTAVEYDELLLDSKPPILEIPPALDPTWSAASHPATPLASTTTRANQHADGVHTVILEADEENVEVEGEKDFLVAVRYHFVPGLTEEVDELGVSMWCAGNPDEFQGDSQPIIDAQGITSDYSILDMASEFGDIEEVVYDRSLQSSNDVDLSKDEDTTTLFACKLRQQLVTFVTGVDADLQRCDMGDCILQVETRPIRRFPGDATGLLDRYGVVRTVAYKGDRESTPPYIIALSPSVPSVGTPGANLNLLLCEISTAHDVDIPFQWDPGAIIGSVETAAGNHTGETHFSSTIYPLKLSFGVSANISLGFRFTFDGTPAAAYLAGIGIFMCEIGGALPALSMRVGRVITIPKSQWVNIGNSIRSYDNGNNNYCEISDVISPKWNMSIGVCNEQELYCILSYDLSVGGVIEFIEFHIEFIEQNRDVVRLLVSWSDGIKWNVEWPPTSKVIVQPSNLIADAKLLGCVHGFDGDREDSSMHHATLYVYLGPSQVAHQIGELASFPKTDKTHALEIDIKTVLLIAILTPTLRARWISTGEELIGARTLSTARVHLTKLILSASAQQTRASPAQQVMQQSAIHPAKSG